MKQGCPLSGNLFILIVEIIGLKIRQNQNIKGTHIEDQTKALPQYANDLWMSTEFEQNTFIQLMNEFDAFARYTGLKINYDKTEILRIGSLQNTDAQFYSRLPLHWP